MLLLLHLLLLIRFFCYSCLFIQCRSFLHYFPKTFCNVVVVVFLLDIANFFYIFLLFIFVSYSTCNTTPIVKFLVYYFLQNHFVKISSFILLIESPFSSYHRKEAFKKKKKVKFTRETFGRIDSFFRIIASLANYHGLSIAM